MSAPPACSTPAPVLLCPRHITCRLQPSSAAIHDHHRHNVTTITTVDHDLSRTHTQPNPEAVTYTTAPVMSAPPAYSTPAPAPPSTQHPHRSLQPSSTVTRTTPPTPRVTHCVHPTPPTSRPITYAATNRTDSVTSAPPTCPTPAPVPPCPQHPHRSLQPSPTATRTHTTTLLPL